MGILHREGNMRKLVAAGIGALAMLTTAGCGGNAVPAKEAFTDAQRARVEAEVEQVMTELLDAAKQGNMSPTMARLLPGAGVCVWGATIYDCQEIFERHREAWSSGDQGWLVRQEMDGEELRVVAISPTVAIAVLTTKANRAIYSNGDVVRAKFASLSVFVLGEDGWKLHSGQQASWPIDSEGES
jgi:hypothetical protein